MLDIDTTLIVSAFGVLTVAALLWFGFQIILAICEARKESKQLEEMLRILDRHTAIMQDHLVQQAYQAALQRYIDKKSAGGADGEAAARERKDTHSF